MNPQIEAALGFAGTCAAVLLFIAPWKTFQRIITNKSTEEFPSFPYVSTLLNCSVWVFYCLPSITPNRPSPLVTNLIGLVFQTGYLFVFVKYARDKAKAQVQIQLAVYAVFMVLFVSSILLFLPATSRSFVVGLFATVFTVVMFGAPLSALAVVLRTRSVEFMPLSLSLMGFSCSATWTLYGLYVQDIFVIVPNVLGMILGIIQLAIYFSVSSSQKRGASYHSIVANDLQQESGITMVELDGGEKQHE